MQHSFRFVVGHGEGVDVGRAAVVALGYGLLAHLSLRLIAQPHNLALVWPASGVLLAALLRSPRRSWPLLATLILLITTLANYLANSPLPISLGFGVANVVEALVAATFLCWRSAPPQRLHTLRDILRFVLVAAVSSNALTALLGAAIPALAFGISFRDAWRIWWVANGVGMVVIGALIVSWWDIRRPIRWGPARRVEAAGLALALVAGSLLLFATPPRSNSFSSPYLIFPVLMWAALRFGTPGASATVAWVAVVAVLATINATGPFALLDLPLTEQVIRVQLFLFIVGLSALILAAVTHERQQAQQHLRQSNLALEQRVAERTTALTAINHQLQHEVAQRQAAQERLEQVLAGVTDQILMLDTAWRYVFVNDQVTVVTGRPCEALLGQTIWEVFPLLVGTTFDVRVRQAMADQTPTRFVCYEPSLQRWFEHRAYPSGSGLTLFSVDITERKRTEQITHFLLELDATLALLADTTEIEQLAVGQLGAFLDVSHCFFAHIADHRSTVLHAYQTAGNSPVGVYDLEAFFSQEALGQLTQGHSLTVEDVTADRRTAPAAPSYQTLGIGAFVTTPVLYQGRWVGTLTVVSASPRAWHIEEVRLLHKVATRVWPRLEQARAQTALRASETRLQVLYEQEQMLRARAEEASRLKDEFLATVSHELRTPLTAFLGYAQLLHGHKRDEAYVARAVEKMLHSANALARLVEDLLDVSRIVRGKLRIEPQPIALIPVIRAALDTIQPTIEAKQQELRVELPADDIRIMADPNRLQQVVWNLLANASKFTPRGGTIGVHLARQDQEVRLAVSDTGQGISPSFLPLVFEHFRQAEGAMNRVHGGLGLGLAIVRHLVELHGGRVEAASQGLGQGATFTVSLPLVSYEPLGQPAGRNALGRS